MLRTSMVSGAWPPHPAALDQELASGHWRRWLLIGLLTALSGGIALMASANMGSSVVTVLGALLLGEALLQVLRARLMPRHVGRVWPIQGSLTASVTGLALLLAPLDGVLSLAVVVGVFLLLHGVARGFLAVMLAPLRGWFWLLAIGAGTIGAGLGLLLSRVDPPTVVIGGLLGLAMLLDGSWTLYGAWRVQHLRPAPLPYFI
jgi:uncharacterized membrane protein HdeD (DUF308 family)